MVKNFLYGSSFTSGYYSQQLWDTKNLYLAQYAEQY